MTEFFVCLAVQKLIATKLECYNAENIHKIPIVAARVFNHFRKGYNIVGYPYGFFSFESIRCEIDYKFRSTNQCGTVA